jgi:restriction endonuclease S subunit
MTTWSTVRISELGHAQRIEAEYYRPEYLEVAESLDAANSVPLMRYIEYLTDGTHITPKYVSQGIPFLSSGNIDPFVVSHNIDKFISEEEHKRLRHCQPDADDLLISKSGRIGTCAVVPKHVKKGDWNIYEGVALLRLSGIEPQYVAAFLNSRYGYSQIKRELKGVAQPHLHLEDIRRIKLFVPSSDQRQAISKLVIDGIKKSREAYLILLDAENLLDTALGLGKFKLQKHIGYMAQFSKLQATLRFDAEHFSPVFASFKASLPANVGLLPLANYLQYCRRGKQPIYSETGLSVINSKHVQTNRIIVEGNRYGIRNADSGLQIQFGDILMNGTGRGTLGRVAPYLFYEPAIPDNHVTILRSAILDPVYVSFYLNSLAGQIQVEMHQRGSSGQIELYPLDIRKFLIWPAPSEFQREIRQLYEKALAAEHDSKRLIEQAKTQVERLIEDAVVHP